MEGTAMGKQYQMRDGEASTRELTIPEEVTVTLAEIAESAKEGLLALSVGAGLQVMQTLMEQSVTARITDPLFSTCSGRSGWRRPAGDSAGIDLLRLSPIHIKQCKHDGASCHDSIAITD
jgi:hypothetical protein